MNNEQPFLPTIQIEKAFTPEEVELLRSTVISDQNTDLDDYIHDWEGPNLNKKLSSRHHFNFDTLTTVSDLIKQKLPKDIVSKLIVSKSFLLTSYIPYEIHCDYNWVECEDDEVPYYLFLLVLNGEGSKTICLDQQGKYLHFVDYKKDNDPLPVDKQMTEQQFKEDFGHCWPQEREYISVKDTFTWSAGSIFAIDMRYFHLSNNFSEDGINEKQCITLFTKTKKGNE
jgi:hypothetical protein